MIRRGPAIATLLIAGIAGLLTIGCRRETHASAIAAPDPSSHIAPIAHRVVSVSASTTETLFAIGAGKQAVGRSRYCDYPAEAAALPAVGGYVDPSLEATLALTPDLVVGARGPAGAGFARSLDARGITTWFPATESFADVVAMIEGLGARTGHATEAASLTTAMRTRRAAMEAALAKAPHPRVLMIFSSKPISAAGPSSFPNEMLAIAGATNVVTKGDAYPMLSLEEVARLDPDVILDAEMGTDTTARSPVESDETWRIVRAAREHHVVRLADERVLRPGPRLVDGIATIAHTLHPEVALP